MKKYLNKLLVLITVWLGFLGTGVAAAINLPSGEIGCTPSGGEQCYMIYLPSGGSKYKKYIGSPEVRFYYNLLPPSSLDPQPANAEATFNNADLVSYSTYNWNLGLPSGTIVGDKRNGKIYIIEPTAPDGDPGSGVGNFSYSNVFPLYVPSLSTPTLSSYVKSSRINWLPAVDNTLGNTTDGGSLPSGAIVQQSVTDDFYRLTGYVSTDGRKVSRKQYIGTPELLSLWLIRNRFFVTADVSGYSNGGNAEIPSSLLVRTVADPTIYFTDDNGYKQHIQTSSDFTNLGFTNAGVRYLQQSTLDSTPSQIWTP